MRESRNNEELQRVKAGGFTWWVRHDVLDQRLRSLLDDPDQYLDGVAYPPNAEQASICVASISNLFLKRYNRASPIKMLKSIFRIAPAKRAFRLAHDLEQAGIPTPRTLAVANKRCAGVLLRSYLVTELIRDALTLEHFPGDRVQTARDTAMLIARLHSAGFIHGDLNLANLLFDRSHRLLIVDLDTMRCVRRVPPRSAADDLARFSRKALLSNKISRSDRARFLKEYCRVRGITDWRSWWNRIEQLNRAEFARLARKNNRADGLDGS